MSNLEQASAVDLWPVIGCVKDETADNLSV